MTYQLIQASAHDTGLPSKSVHCVITSPPFYGLRQYAGEQNVEWPEVQYSPMPGLQPLTIPAMVCGLGEEDTPEAFIGHLILVMREMWRVLRDDGCAFINLGDSFSGSGGAHAATHQNDGLSKSRDRDGVVLGGKKAGIPAKNLYMIPSRFALACQADGWIVRSRMPWIKRNGMPDSCEDRPSQVVEDIFMLAKSEKYFFDMEAVKQPAAQPEGEAKVTGQRKRGILQDLNTSTLGTNQGASMRNFRSSDFFFKTWQGLATSDEGEPLAMVINTKGFSGAHFACFPPDLPLTLIKSGTSAHGVCPQCQAPWVRVVERESHYGRRQHRDQPDGVMPQVDSSEWRPPTIIDRGWQPSCTCNAGEPIPATVCDPFNGSGSTGKAALQLNRSYVGVDISKEYLTELAPDRLSNIQIELALA